MCILNATHINEALAHETALCKYNPGIRSIVLDAHHMSVTRYTTKCEEQRDICKCSQMITRIG